MRRLVCLVLVALVVFAVPQRARADARAMRPDARVHYDRGLKLYARHQYDDAIAELRAGLAIDPQPEILYALGQAERRRGHCDRAVEYYQSCLALVKDPVAAAAVKVQIERCNVQQGDNKEEAELPGPDPFAPGAPQPTTPQPSEPTTSPAAPPAPALQAPPPVQAPAPTTVASAPPHRARWQRDALGLSLLGVGAAVAVTGGALFGVAETRLDAAADSYQQYADARSASTMRAVGIGGLALGGVLVVVGVVRLALVGAGH